MSLVIPTRIATPLNRVGELETSKYSERGYELTLIAIDRELKICGKLGSCPEIS
ncbi:hypothetical protein CPL00146S_CDS0087 [Escherichia phage SmurfNell]|uniref:Uncharacterized protein n=1 Tax=Escherichia phage SuperGirl TaxID=2851993 RepID=A0AAE7VYS3_9CAUD|nr:hypothetical protein bas29_0079 [Escherichia phage SuperGirl]